MSTSVGVWVRELGLGNATFSDLERGEVFHFAGSDRAYVKRNDAGWYEDPITGAKYRTGRFTGVVRCTV